MEEDIKVLEEFIEKNIKSRLRTELNANELQAIENLINRNKTLEKEIKLMKSVNLEDNYIPKSKIREKIEELEKEIENINNKNDGYWEDTSIILDEQKQVLQELLEERN